MSDLFTASLVLGQRLLSMREPHGSLGMNEYTSECRWSHTESDAAPQLAAAHGHHGL